MSMGLIGSELSSNVMLLCYVTRYAIDTLQAGTIEEEEGEETTIIGLTFGGYLKSKVRNLKFEIWNSKE